MESASTAFRPRGFGQIIGDSFKTYFADIAKYIAIAAIVIVPVALCTGALWAIGDYTRTAADGWSSNLSKWLVTDLLFPAGTVVLAMLAYPLMYGALIHAIGQKRVGQQIDVSQAYFSALEKAGGLIGAQLVVALLLSAMMVSLICLAFAVSQHLGWLYILTAVLAVGIPFALYFSLKWLFVQQAVMLEGRQIMQALPRSSDLVTGSWWRVLGIWVLPVIPAFAGACIGVLLVFWMHLGAFGSLVLLSAFPALVVVPLSTVAQTVLYFDLHAGKEQYGPEVMTRELWLEPPVAPATVGPEGVPQMKAVHPWQPRKLKLAYTAIAVVVLLSALTPPAVLLLPDYIDRGDIQISARSNSTGRQIGVGHGALKTIKFTDFAIVVDFNGPVEMGDQENTVVCDVKWWGDSWMYGCSMQPRVFALEETKEHFLANGVTPEDDPANEVRTKVEILDKERILVSPIAGEFPSGSQIVLDLDFVESTAGYTARLFTR